MDNRTWEIAAAVLAAVLLLLALEGCQQEKVVPRSGYQTDVYVEQGGSKMVAASGGEIEIQSGATLDVQSGATFNPQMTGATINGNQMITGNLVVSGTSDLVGNISSSTGAVTVTDDLNVTGALYSSFTDLAVSDGDTITPTYTTYALDTTGAVTVTLAASGQEGQLLAIINDDANTTVIADTNLRSSDGNAITLAGAHDIGLFIYQDSEWLEIATIADS